MLVRCKQAECSGIGGRRWYHFDAERALCVEVLLLSRVNHSNLLQKRLGFCDKRIPVFEFILSTVRSTTTYREAAVTAHSSCPSSSRTT